MDWGKARAPVAVLVAVVYLGGSSGGGSGFSDASRRLRWLCAVFSEFGIVLDEVHIGSAFASTGLVTLST